MAGMGFKPGCAAYGFKSGSIDDTTTLVIFTPEQASNYSAGLSGIFVSVELVRVLIRHAKWRTGWP
jgi:hypothetical protein